MTILPLPLYIDFNQQQFNYSPQSVLTVNSNLFLSVPLQYIEPPIVKLPLYIDFNQQQFNYSPQSVLTVNSNLFLSVPLQYIEFHVQVLLINSLKNEVVNIYTTPETITIEEEGIYHLVALYYNDKLRSFTAPGLKIVDERRGTILTSDEFERPTDDTLNTVIGFVYYNGEAVANCKVFCVRNNEIYDVVYSDSVGKYEIYAKAPDIIVAEPTNNTTERPKVVI